MALEVEIVSIPARLQISQPTGYSQIFFISYHHAGEKQGKLREYHNQGQASPLKCHEGYGGAVDIPHGHTLGNDSLQIEQVEAVRGWQAASLGAAKRILVPSSLGFAP